MRAPPSTTFPHVPGSQGKFSRPSPKGRARMSRDWIWAEVEPGQITLAGDIAKMFRHEEQKAPGIFALEAPPDAAVLLAREVIQNSWDAAAELKRRESAAPQFAIQFRFYEVVGAEKAQMVENLGLGQLAERAKIVNRSDVGLTESDCLDSIGDASVPLRLLEIIEQGATGMYGSWEKSDSHMHRALLSLGFTEKRQGAGGSYGYGKAGLISGSRIRNVVAYTCFKERTDEPGITRRLLGMTYWGMHAVDGKRYLGFASLSAGHPGYIDPFVNDAADEIAASLGMTVRDPGSFELLGTTFLLPDPTVMPSDLVKAIERFWWPALIEGDFVVDVVDYDGSHLYPRPSRDPVLHTFIDAWEVAMGVREPGPNDRRTPISAPDGLSPAGVLGLVADLNGWSYANEVGGPEDEPVEHKSLVALTRGPRMVVEYFVAGGSQPFVRGVFIADGSIDNLLRLTEPKAHDSWQTRSQDGELDSEAVAMANHVIAKIRQTVNNHRAKLKPPPPPPDKIDLPVFDEIMRRILAGSGRGVAPPVAEPRPISIHLDYHPKAVGDQVAVSGWASFALSDNFEGDRARVRYSIAYRFLEDDRVGEFADLSVVPPDGLEEVEPGIYEGILERDSEVRFTFESVPYDSRWSGRLIVSGDVVPEKQAVTNES